jgi:hypothetical protein
MWMLALLMALGIASSAAQQLTPLLGQGVPPPGGVEVFTNVIIERLLGVDDTNYRFEIVLYMQLNWEDARARPAMLNATAAAAGGGQCALPCSALYRYIPGASECCDGVWLPHLEFTNARGFSQDRITRYGIRFPAINATNANAVAWWVHVQVRSAAGLWVHTQRRNVLITSNSVRLQGEFYTPLSFKAFPFDRQLLMIQLAYADRTPEDPVTFTQSSTGRSLYQADTGDNLSGWSVKGLDIHIYSYPDESLALKGKRSAGGVATHLHAFAPCATDRYVSCVPPASSASSPGDPWGLHPVNSSQPQYVGYLWHQVRRRPKAQRAERGRGQRQWRGRT